jgi:large subunit ribosomal protein L22
MSSEHDSEHDADAEPPAVEEPVAAKDPHEKAAAAKPRAKAAGAKEPDVKAAAGKRPAAKQPAKQPAAKQPAAKKPATAKKQPSADPPAVADTPAEAKPKRAPRLRKGAKPAPSRRVVRAHARHVRTSARKARMVCGHLRGKSVQEARAILAFTPRDVARDWSKLLESAVANAESNHELLEDDLIIREAYADEGPTIKRFRPRAMGRATPIRKRTSHLTITLTAGTKTRTTQRQG